MSESLKSLFRHLSAASSENEQVTAVLLSRSPNPRMLNANLWARSLANDNSLARQRDTIPLTLARVCYASELSCHEATNNCSGHGFCHRKTGSGGEATVSDCYACKCQESTIKKDDGTIQKVRWAGTACQKRDISSPFFLIAGVTVIGVLALSTAIGLLFRVGQDELPSVISAGVGAIRTQK